MKIIWNALIYMTVRGVRYGVLFGALYGVGYLTIFTGLSLYCLIGVIYGVIIGGITGLITGIASGLVVGLVTRGFFTPLTRPLMYRRVIGITSALATFVSAEIVFRLFNGGGINRPDNPTSFFYFLLPSLIAAGLAAYAAVGFANRYIDESDSKNPRKPSAFESYLTANL